jgi:hypothetical protein
MTSGNNNTILGNFSGNNDGLDIRTSSTYAVISDGLGNRQITMAEGQTLALDSAVPNSGTGITFPATQSASSNANTLDDYEEGTWTPAQGSGLTVVGAFSSSGKYTKVGRLVNIQGSVSGATSVSVNAVGIITGNLPFSSVGGFTGIAVNAALTSSVGTTCSLLDLYSTGTISATTSITFSITYTA